MTLRDKIMDKYWLEFSEWAEGYAEWCTEKQFWAWFQREKVNKQTHKLEDYLK